MKPRTPWSTRSKSTTCWPVLCLKRTRTPCSPSWRRSRRETSSFQRFLKTSFLLSPRPQRRNQRASVPGRSPSGRCSPPEEPWTVLLMDVLHECLLHLENPPPSAMRDEASRTQSFPHRHMKDLARWTNAEPRRPVRSDVSLVYHSTSINSRTQPSLLTPRLLTPRLLTPPRSGFTSFTSQFNECGAASL